MIFILGSISPHAVQSLNRVRSFTTAKISSGVALMTWERSTRAVEGSRNATPTTITTNAATPMTILRIMSSTILPRTEIRIREAMHPFNAQHTTAPAR